PARCLRRYRADATPWCPTRRPRRTALLRAPPATPRSGRSSGRARAAPSGALRARAPPRARRDTAPRAGPVALLASRLFGVIRGRCDLEPLGPAVAAPVHGVEVGRLDFLRDGAGLPDHLVVDLANRRHLGSRPDHEHLVREVEVGADDRLLDHTMTEILRDLDHGVAGDAHEDRG